MGASVSEMSELLPTCTQCYHTETALKVLKSYLPVYQVRADDQFEDSLKLTVKIYYYLPLAEIANWITEQHLAEEVTVLHDFQ
jgi:hypothetical protein